MEIIGNEEVTPVVDYTPDAIDEYPQPQSLDTLRFRKNVAFNKPALPAALDTESIAHTNGVRSNWSITFATNQSSEPYKGVGITTNTIHNTDVHYSLSGKNVDAVIIDTGCGMLHPEFKKGDGTYRAKDLILDGPSSRRIIHSHGTACCAQVGGNSFGLAFESNVWSIRGTFSGAGGVLSNVTAVDVVTLFHEAKKVSQPGDPDPTICSNSYGSRSETGNSNGVSYSTGYRGNTLSYTGTGSDTSVPSNAGAARNHKQFTRNISGSSSAVAYSGSGVYNTGSSSSNSAAEDAIAAGVIFVSSAGNSNQKLSDSTDADFDNWYSSSSKCN